MDNSWADSTYGFTDFHHAIWDEIVKASRGGEQFTQLACITWPFQFHELMQGPEKEAEFLDCIDDMIRFRLIGWGAGTNGDMAFAPWIRMRDAGRNLMKIRAEERAKEKKFAFRKEDVTE